MKRAKFASYILPAIVLLALLLAIFLNRTPSENIVQDSTDKPGGERIVSAKPEATTAPPDNSETAPPQPSEKQPSRIEDGAMVTSRIPDEEWNELKDRHGLSIEPRHDFILNPIPVSIEMAPLEAARRLGVDRLQFDIGLDLPVIGEIGRRDDYGDEAYTFHGSLEGHPGSDFSISVYEDAVVGTFSSSAFGVRQLRFVGEGVHKVEEIDPSLAPPCGDRLIPDGSIAGTFQSPASSADLSDADGNAGGLSIPAASGDLPGVQLDVLVAYSQGAITYEGSLNALLALINEGISNTNIILVNSQIDAHVRLAGTTFLPYEEGDSGIALRAIRDPFDGVQDGIHATRDALGADFVSFWTPLTDAGGRGYLLTGLTVGDAPFAFNVCAPSSQWRHTFTHELGHNWGSAHAVGDADQARGRGVFDYSHGWRWGGAENKDYRSIMAYSPGDRVMHFSNPNVYFLNGSTGVPNLEDNARSINATVGIMAQFRSSVLDDHGGTTNSATSVPSNSVTPGNLESSSDIDMFRFVINSTATVTMQSTGATNTAGRLLDSNGGLIESNSNSGSGGNFLISRTVPAGTYFAEVSSESNSTGIYSLDLSIGTSDDHGGSISEATPVPLGSTIAGNLENGGDEDFFRISIPEPGTLTISTTGFTDTFGYLLDSNGIAINGDDDSGTDFNFSITAAVLPGTYYARVEGYASFVTGAYNLVIEFESTPDDHANTFTEATVVTPGTISSPSNTAGEIEAPGDVDMLAFTLLGTSGEPESPYDATPVTIDFEGPGTFPYSEDGYTVRPFDGGRFTRATSGNSLFADNGGSYIRLLTGESFVVEKDDAALFDAVNVDLSEYSTVFQRSESFLWRGFKPDGSVVSHTFVTDGIIDGTGPQQDFETFSFPSGFTGLVRLETFTPLMTIDNLVLRDSDTNIPLGDIEIRSLGSTDVEATLYRSDFSVVTFNDNGGTNQNFLISLPDFPAGSYYLGVNEHGNNSLGSYTVQIGYDQQAARPSTPTGFSATTDNPNGIVLGWDVALGANTYAVYRNTVDNFSSSTAIANSLTTRSFTDTTRPAGQDFYYWVTAINSTGPSDPAGPRTGRRAYEPPVITQQPGNTSVVIGETATIQVTATTSIGSLSYQWYRGITGDTSTLVGVNGPSLNVPNVTATQRYWVRVSNGLNTVDSNTTVISRLLTPPALVSASSATSASQIFVRWLPIEEAVSYAIYRGTTPDAGSAVRIGTTSDTFFNDGAASPGQSYYYFITTVNEAGSESSASAANSVPGSLSGGVIDPALILRSTIGDFSYSGDGTHLYVADDSGWIDQYKTFDGRLSSWIGVNETINGIAVKGERLLAIRQGNIAGNGVLYDIHFGESNISAQSELIALEAGETGFYDVAFATDEKALLTSESSEQSTPVREFDLSERSVSLRTDFPTSDNRTGGSAFFAQRSTATLTTTGGSEFFNNFSNGTASFGLFNGNAFTRSGDSSHAVDNGKLRLFAGTNSSSRVTAAFQVGDTSPIFNPQLSNNSGLLTWAFNLSNENGAFNNLFEFAISSSQSSSGTSTYYYRLSGGGYVGNRMLFTKNSGSGSPFGTNSGTLIDYTNGLAVGSEGAFRITFDPATGAWSIYFEQSATPRDPMTITNLIGSVVDTSFTSADLPWIFFVSRSTGTVFVDNLTFSTGDPDTGIPPGSERELDIIDLRGGSTESISYQNSDDSFSSQFNAPGTTVFAASSAREEWTAHADGTSTRIFDANGNIEATLDASGGIAFSPTAEQFYLADGGANALKVFSTRTWEELISIPVADGIPTSGGPAGAGKVEVRPDGRELAIGTQTGIRFIDLDPVIEDQTPTVTPEIEQLIFASAGEQNQLLSKTYTVTNPSIYPIRWSATSEDDFVSLSPASGVLPGNSSVQVTASPAASVNDWAVGTMETAEISFANTGTANSVNRELTIEMTNMANLPVYEDFEDEIRDYWSESGLNFPRIQRTDNHNPSGGNFHLVMDSTSPHILSRTEFTLSVNLTGASNVYLQFNVRGLGSETRTTSPSSPFTAADFDGVSISQDGVDWYAVLNYGTNFNSGYDVFLDLDAAAASRSLTYGPGFRIRFHHHGNRAASQGGIAIDDIQLTSADDRSVPGEISISSRNTSITNNGTHSIGAVPIDSSAPITVTNTGLGPLDFINMSGSSLSAYDVFGTLNSRLFPGSSSTFNLRPKTTGQNSGSVRITSNSASNSIFSFNLSGTGIHTLESWRQLHFGSSTNDGIAANSADPNSDTISNLEAFALGLIPAESSVHPLSIETVSPTEVTATYTRNAFAEIQGITFEPQWSNGLADEDWSSSGITEEVIETIGERETVRITLPNDGNLNKFIRLRVTAPPE